MADDEQWRECFECEGAGQIENLSYDPNHDCAFRYDCDCDDAIDFFMCETCDGHGWVEKLDD